MKVLLNRRGSLSVLLAMMFIVMISATFILVKGSEARAIRAGVKATGALWLQSELGQYDKHLYDDYGIYAFQGDSKSVRRRIDYMAEYTFDDKSYIDYRGCTVNFGLTSISNPEIFKKQLVEVAKYDLGKALIGNSNKDNNVNDLNESVGEIRNDAILGDLPSSGRSASISIDGIKTKLKNVSSISQVIKYSGDSYLIQRYIDAKFKTQIDDKGQGNTVFAYEKEYIISGATTDQQNRLFAKGKIIALRQIMNTAYIYSNPKMMEEITTLAAILTPGPQAVLTQLALVQGWALAESINDYNLLIANKKVQLVKTSESWATDLESIATNNSTEYIDTGNEVGETYDQYLDLFLWLMDEDVKLLRMMDLIQLNMKLNYYDDFLMKEYYTGLTIDMKVNGNIISVGRSYYDDL